MIARLARLASRIQILRLGPSIRCHSLAASKATINIANSGIKSLRPYQQDCIQTSLKLFANGNRSQVVSLPVGSGKTVIFSHLIDQISFTNSSANKVLVLAHREELIDQAYRHLCSILSHKSIDIEQGKRQASPFADIIVASVPTLGRKHGNRIKRFDASQFKLIIIDEAHHSSATSYLRVLGHFNALLNDETLPIKNIDGFRSDIWVWGCSGTLQRTDGVGFSHVYEQVSYSRTLFQMWDEKWLAPIKAYSINTNTDLSKVARNRFDFVVSQLATQINTPERNGTIVNAWLNYKDKFRSTLVFTANRQHARDLAEVFRLSGNEAHLVDGNTPSDERAELVSNFKEQKFPVMINCGVFTEGTDIPCIDCVIIARPTRSSTLFQQMVGRGLRSFPNKEFCSIFDCFDNFSGCDLVTLPSLVGLPPNFDCKGQDLVKVHFEMKKLINNDTDCYHALSLKEARAVSRNKLLDDLDQLDLSRLHDAKVSPISIDKDISKIHGTMWRKFYTQIEKNCVWGFNLGKNNIFVLRNTSGSFDVYAHIVDRSGCNISVIANHESIKSVENFHHVMTSASASNALKCGIVTGERLVGRFKMILLSRNANWKSAPATDAQIKLIKQLSLRSRRVKHETLTKGAAMAILNGFFLRQSVKRLKNLLKKKKDLTNNLELGLAATATPAGSLATSY